MNRYTVERRAQRAPRLRLRHLHRRRLHLRLLGADDRLVDYEGVLLRADDGGADGVRLRPDVHIRCPHLVLVLARLLARGDGNEQCDAEQRFAHGWPPWSVRVRYLT